MVFIEIRHAVVILPVMMADVWNASSWLAMQIRKTHLLSLLDEPEPIPDNRDMMIKHFEKSSTAFTCQIIHRDDNIYCAFSLSNIPLFEKSILFYKAGISASLYYNMRKGCCLQL